VGGREAQITCIGDTIRKQQAALPQPQGVDQGLGRLCVEGFLAALRSENLVEGELLDLPAGDLEID